MLLNFMTSKSRHALKAHANGYLLIRLTFNGFQKYAMTNLPEYFGSLLLLDLERQSFARILSSI